MNVCLGLDTSNYRTSTALCAIDAGAKDSLYYEEKRLLCVENGQRGLMQSQVAQLSTQGRKCSSASTAAA